jgi:hypothetical protein
MPDFLILYVIITSFFGLTAVVIILIWLRQLLAAVQSLSQSVAVEVQRRTGNEKRLTDIENDVKDLDLRFVNLRELYISHFSEESGAKWERLNHVKKG